MLSIYFLNIYLLILTILPINLNGQEYGNLWCQQGDKKHFSPAQCSPQTVECFKFICDGIDDGFVARGCGVSILKSAAGLPNESCHQAQSMCEHIGGKSTCQTCANKHLCNSVFSNNFLIALLSWIVQKILF